MSNVTQVNTPPVGPASGPSSDPSAPMHRKVSLWTIVEEVRLWSIHSQVSTS